MSEWSRTRRSWWLAPLLLFLVSLPAVTPRLYASDEIEYFAYLRSLWFDKDLSFDNEYRYFFDHGIARAHGFQETFLEQTTATGLRVNYGTIGSALLWAPFYGAADLGVRVSRAAGSPVEASGFSRPYFAAVAYGSAVYGFLSVLLSISVARRLTGSGEVAGLIVWLGTPLLFYMYVAPGMSHACSAFAVAAFVAVWLAVRARWSARGWMALGALAALMTMVREQDAFFLVGVILDWTLTLADDVAAGRRNVVVSKCSAALLGAATFLLVFLPQALTYAVLNGHLGPEASVSAKMRWMSPHAGQVLLSPEHGLFFWTPIALVAILGLIALGLATPVGPAAESDSRRIAICLLTMFAAQVYVSGSNDGWTVAGAFGQRRFVSTTVLLVVGIATALRYARGWQRSVVSVAAVLSVWWNLSLMAQFGAGLMDRQRLQLATNAYNTFVVIPRNVPDLAYRYLFDRSSFYRPSDR